MKTMLLKNGIFTMLMFAFILVALPSCDKDEETPEPTFKETLVGTWDIDSYLRPTRTCRELRRVFCHKI